MIIGLAYKKGVGKDTLASFIDTWIRCNAPDIIIKKISFAAKLKDICYQLYGWAGLQRGIYYETHRDTKEVMLPGLKMSPRAIWIHVGNALRNIYENTWIDFALIGVKAEIILITDVRFRNEAEAIKDVGGKVIKINRPTIAQGTDPAEIELDTWHDWDLIVDNNQTLRELNSIAVDLAREIVIEATK